MTALLMIAAAGTYWSPAWAADTITAEQAIENYRERFDVAPALTDCPHARGDEIVVCGRDLDSIGPPRLLLPIEREPGEIVRHVGEPGSGLEALGAGGCLRLCPSQVGVNLKMLKTLADGVQRLLEGDE